MPLVHHHLIFQAQVGRADLGADAGSVLLQFLRDLVREIDMQILIEPQVTFSKNNAWTGLVGIITSHMSFHYWTEERYLQLDIYSCKSFDIDHTFRFLKDWWKTAEEHVLFLNRESGKDFEISRYETP